jgi:HEAT repeat protein
LLEEFRRTSAAQHPALKWAIGNALSTVTTVEHADALLELARDRSHGAGRQMIVEGLARFSKDDRIVPTLQSLLEDEDVALQAMAGLRRRLGPAEALDHIRPLTSHPSERVRRAAA